MNDDLELQQHVPWVFAAAAAGMAWMSRLALGRQFKTNDETDARLTRIESDVAYIRGRIDERQ